MRRFSTLLALVLINSCGAETQHSSPSGIADNSNLWPNPGAIPVCFTNSADHPAVALDVQRRVTRNYNQTQNIRFTGWGECDNNTPSPAIRIGLTPVDFWTLIFIGNVTGCSQLGPGVDSFSDCTDITPADNFNMFIDPAQYVGTDVHEFGHALGLRHEHARTDAPVNCQTGESAPEAGHIVYFGDDFDSDSVMGYCNGTNDLSADDIATLDALYP
ncbi:hypothetical protein [Pseudobacteriovorax antillogorgiicola]|uniref:Astacin (Peptidase family M12A) n=1 Tax=Pseudobacteriovorax antillogorgiicola TaxID=1513793 RepID=A0A1Y6CGD8_9BACT|nr:hypothetical protein [Pseudobacteriovorax antillogorgiicola]TCS47602.1 hypothetical protein EDD56_12043 [Pseudobacteriovorax antillogorgiicola]SMF60130.1 Astacin (Peptidase family M12A) [Pseudobacteriovorax antillogorgiicola]